MNRTSRRFAAALVVGFAVCSVLTGCALGGIGLNEDKVAAEIEAAVVESVPGADGAYVGFATDGSPTRHTLFVRVFLPSVDRSTLGAIADATLKIAWEQMPTEPSSVGFQAFDGPKPAKVDRVSFDNLNLGALEATFGAGSVGLAGQMLDLSSTQLAARYGDWKNK